MKGFCIALFLFFSSFFLNKMDYHARKCISGELIQNCFEFAHVMPCIASCIVNFMCFNRIHIMSPEASGGHDK
jgi:hypothetical protein